MRLLEASGKKTVLVRVERPGFIVNRLMGALEREIDYLLDEGIVTPEDLDVAVKSSTGFRFACLGPMEVEDMIGLDVAATVSGRVFKGLSNATEPSPMLVEKVERGELGIKSGKGWYDYSGRTREEVLKEKNAKLLPQLKLFLQAQHDESRGVQTTPRSEGGPVFDLTGKVAIVTGGGGGLGRPISVALAECGADVLVDDFDADHLAATVKEIEALGRKCVAVTADLTDAAAMKGMADKAVEEFGKIDILVNVAGTNARFAAEEMPAEEFERVLRVNVLGTFLACQAVGRVMIEQKQRRDRQHVVGARQGRARHGRLGLRHEQGRRGPAHPHAGGRVGQVRHPRQRRRAGADHDRHDARVPLRARGLRQDDRRDPDAAPGRAIRAGRPRSSCWRRTSPAS